MADNIEDFTRQMLRRIDEKIDRVIEEVRDLKGRMTSLEQSFANQQHLIASIAEGQAGIHKRIDRVDYRLDRIERRLDLVDASSE